MSEAGEEKSSGYEKRDLRFSAVAGGWAALVLLCLGAGLAAKATLKLFSKGSSANAAPALPPQPRLQTDPVGDLRRLRAQEDAVLAGYGWVDRPQGVVRIPIEQAMALLLKKGLPARTQPAEGGR